jgi:hypothetical protein
MDTLTVEQLAALLRDAEAAHGQYEASLGHADPDWPSWYAQYMLKQIAAVQASEKHQ